LAEIGWEDPSERSDNPPGGEGIKEQKPCSPASSPSATAQPVAQADAGCAFGSVARLSRRAA